MSKLNSIIKSAKMVAQSSINFCKVRSPEILAVAGVAAIVTGTVLACRATTKAGKVIEEHKEEYNKLLDDIHEATTNPELAGTYDEEHDAPVDKFIVYVHTGAKFVKLYAPAVICIGLGIAAMLGSNHILKNRWLGAAAAYNLLDGKFKDYRKRVGEEIGEEKENDIFQNIQTKAAEIMKEDGMTEVKTVKTADPTRLGSPYAVIFDEHSRYWKRDANYNKLILQCYENTANEMLRARGYLYLYEVYELLGYFYEPSNDVFDLTAEQAEAARHVGWMLDKNGKPYPGCDGRVKFSVLDASNARAYDFQRGWDASAVIDFNVDGDILAKMYRNA